MKARSRANMVSSSNAIRGALIEETYAVFAAWDFDRSKRENFDHLRARNYVGAGSASWLQKVVSVLNRRFDPAGRDRSLVVLAQRGILLDEWKPLLLWHMTRDEFLVRDFFETWLFSAYEAGTFRVRSEDLEAYLADLGVRSRTAERPWSVNTSERVADGLLKIAVDFGLLRGSVAREFSPYHLPERSFLYLLHTMRDENPSPRKVVASTDWRLFLMRPVDVEQELLRLHQFRKLDYQVAGTLVQLSLPCTSAREYAERMVA